MELLGVPRGVMLRSTAKYAIADITLDFAEGSDIYWARQQVAERYAGVSGSLPEGVSGGLAPISTPLSDVFMFTIEGGGLTLSERRALLDWTLRPALRTLPGVADVNVLGGEAKSFAVVPDRARLSAAGLSFSDVITAIGRNNRNDGAGRLDAGEDTLIVRRRRDPHFGRFIPSDPARGGQWYAPSSPGRRGPGAHRRRDDMAPSPGTARAKRWKASWWRCAGPMPRRWSKPFEPGWTR